MWSKTLRGTESWENRFPARGVGIMFMWLRSLVSVIALQHVRREAGSTGGVCEVCVYTYVPWKVSCVCVCVCGECEVEGIMYVVPSPRDPHSCTYY